jgi:putative redox protein
MTATIVYEGNLRCNATHLQSGTLIETDAPTDNKGKGERFSPTDLVCTALGTCMITTMAIRSAEIGVELDGTIVNFKKYMQAAPRRISKIDVEIIYPATLVLNEEQFNFLKTVGDNCPVVKSLHESIAINATYTHAQSTLA